MPHSGSKPHPLRSAIVAGVLAAVIVGAAWLLFRSDRAKDSPPAGAVAAPAAENPEGQQANAGTAASKPARALKGAARVNAALPPPGTPLVQIYDELKARSDAGDVVAAGRLFQEAHRCFRARMTTLALPATARAILRQDTSKLDAEQLKEREERLGRIEQEIDEARAEKTGCEGLTDEQLQLAPLAMQAARLGDAEATRCYVSGLFLYAGGLLDHPEWLAEYRSSALPLAEAALARGDWAIVEQLRNSYSGWSRIAPMGQLLGIDPAQAYRYLKLQRLGAPESSAARLDDELALATHELSAEQIAAGDAWAQGAYLRYFGGQPASSDPADMKLCPI